MRVKSTEEETRGLEKVENSRSQMCLKTRNLNQSESQQQTPGSFLTYGVWNRNSSSFHTEAIKKIIKKKVLNSSRVQSTSTQCSQQKHKEEKLLIQNTYREFTFYSSESRQIDIWEHKIIYSLFGAWWSFSYSTVNYSQLFYLIRLQIRAKNLSQS